MDNNMDSRRISKSYRKLSINLVIDAVKVTLDKVIAAVIIRLTMNCSIYRSIRFMQV